MKAILCMLFGIILLPFSEMAQAQAIKPCITVNGNMPTPGTGTTDPDYYEKCPGRTVTLAVKNCGTQTINPLTYSWINSSSPGFPYSTPTVTTSLVGTWIVTVTYNGPSGTGTFKDTLQLNNYTLPTFAVTGPGNTPVASHCSYDPVNLTASVNPQIVSSSYRWFIHPNNTQDTSGTVAGTSNPFVQMIPTTQWVTVTAKESHGCPLVATIYAPVPTPVTPPDLGPDKYKCPEIATQLLSTSGNATYLYAWNGGAETVGANTYTATGTGKFWVTVRTPALNSCKVADTIYIYNYASPVVATKDTAICYHSDGILRARATGTGTLTYQWSPTTYLTSGTTTLNPTVDFSSNNSVGFYPIVLTVTDGNSCAASATANVEHMVQGRNPEITVDIDTLLICSSGTNNSMQFVTNPAVSYPNNNLYFQWTPSTYLSSSTAEDPTVDLTGAPLSTPIQYSVSITDDKGCVLVVTTSATLAPAVSASVTFAEKSICLGTSETLRSSATGGTGALSYQWSPATDLNTATADTAVSTPTENRIYTVTVNDTYGCSDSKTVKLNAVDVKVNFLSDDTSGYSAEPMVLDPIVNSGAYTYVWKNKTTNTLMGTNKAQAVTEDATYIVIATDPASGCYAGDSIDVTFQQGNPRMIYVPNVVNPTSVNTENKTVKVYGTAVQEEDFTFMIFNKWGEMIYQTTSFTDANTRGWNGVYKTDGGVEQNLAVFTYSLHGRYFDGQEFDKTGSITLMR